MVGAHVGMTLMTDDLSASRNVFVAAVVALVLVLGWIIWTRCPSSPAASVAVESPAAQRVRQALAICEGNPAAGAAVLANIIDVEGPGTSRRSRAISYRTACGRVFGTRS